MNIYLPEWILASSHRIKEKTMSSNKFTKGSGDFRGDFSRDTFDPAKQFSRVLMQQGRVQLDADWNEQVSILLHYMRQLGRDLMGPHGAPAGDDGGQGTGFEISKNGTNSDFSISSGSYYVDGIRCENKNKVEYSDQPNYPFTEDEKKELLKTIDEQHSYLVYLDVWERHLSYVEDDSIREKALGKADTATRAKVVWQVKTKKIEETVIANEPKKYANFLNVLKEEERLPGTGKLKARAKGDEVKKEPCLTSPEASYRGAENQLYRVEIHDPETGGDGKATFKWSRENGSVIFPITDIAGKTISLEHLGRDDRFSLQQGDWVEVLDDDVILRNKANPLLKVTAVDQENLQVTLEGTLESSVGQDSAKHPYLRRWDHCGDIPKGIKVEKDRWITLEDCIEIYFQEDEGAVYQTGDYWLIPARTGTATGDVEWPKDEKTNQPMALEPHGVEHHYAPLAIIDVDDGSIREDITDLRRHLDKGWG
jgi:hypothetical protein